MNEKQIFGVSIPMAVPKWNNSLYQMLFIFDAAPLPPTIKVNGLNVNFGMNLPDGVKCLEARCYESNDYPLFVFNDFLKHEIIETKVVYNLDFPRGVVYLVELESDVVLRLP